MRLRRPAIRAVKCLQGRHPTVTHSSYLSVSFSLPPLSIRHPLCLSLFLSSFPRLPSAVAKSPCIPSKYPPVYLSSDADDYSALVSRKRTLSSRYPRLTFARTHENSPDQRTSLFSPRVSLRRVSFAYPRASDSSPSISFSLSLSLSLFASPPRLKHRARSWRQRNHHRPVLRRLIIGESGGGRGRLREEKGGQRWCGIARGWHHRDSWLSIGDTTLPSAGSTIPRACGGTNIAFSVAFLSYMPLRLLLFFYFFFFFGGLSRRCRRPPVNPGCPAATRQRCGELAGRISFLGSESSTAKETLSLLQIIAFSSRRSLARFV